MAYIRLHDGAAAPPEAAASWDPGALAAPVVALLDVGLLDEIGARHARVDDLSRAHPVWRVTLGDRRRLVVKAGIGHGGPDLAVECLVYRMTRWCAPLAAALPAPLVVDEDQQLLVLADVGGPDSAGSLAQRVGFPALLGGPTANDNRLDPSIARDLGRTVGTVHRATAGFPLPPAAPPLVLGLVGRPEAPEAAHVGPEVRSTLAELGAIAAVTRAVAALRRPVAGCLVNHDLKWDNVVLGPAGPSTAAGVVLLDWELAGLGDPAWDLGCLLAEHLVRDTGPPSVDVAAAELLAGYADGARLRREVVPVLAHRATLAAGLRIAQLALEIAYTPLSGESGAIARLTDRALSVLTSDTLTEEVRRCVS
jgi:Ser/Thr protein kinase RdoA (MazF antagonist)